jgi:hypothetical protein
MRAVVFVGPSLARAAIAPADGLAVLPPAAQGDLYRAARERPRAIGLIDGYFAEVPAVWHKEILWAMAEGIHVLGAASMGALRAAELAAFGMQGVGAIFAAYQDGRLEDDDEVAVVHGPPEAGYAALSEPMVNIRATLAHALAEAVIAPATGQALERLAKGRFYAERAWPTLLADGADAGLPAAELAALAHWLPSGRIDQKALDAQALLAALRAQLAEPPPPLAVGYAFAWTQMWDDVVRLAPRAGAAAAAIEPERVLDELRLEDGFGRLLRAALLRLLAAREDQRAGAPPPAPDLAAWRARHGLFGRRQLDAWLAANDLDDARLARLLAEQAAVEDLALRLAPDLVHDLADELRLAGAYERLAARARAKRDHLAERGLADPQPDDLPLLPMQLRAWYFERRLGSRLPDDLEAAARAQGFPDLAAFDLALRREFLYGRGIEQPWLSSDGAKADLT